MRIVRLIVMLATLVLATGCGLLDEAQTTASTGATSENSSSIPAPPDQADALGIALRRDGDERLTPLSPSATVATGAVIETLPTQGRGPKTGYRRDLFGEAWDDGATGVLWSDNGCRTRDDILARDLDEVVKRDACVVTSGDYLDPYTGDQIRFMKANAEESPVDHVVPISFAWQMGADRWSPDRRLQFANDPLNLVLTTKVANSAKGDSDPASWLPPRKSIRCAYVLRFALVSLKYSLPVTPADKQIMLVQCSGRG